jgi:glutaredoxin
MVEISVISLPDCSKCEEIKAYLKENNIPYTEKTFNSEIQTDLVMENIYYNPPILVIGDKKYSYKDFMAKKNEILPCNLGCIGCEDSTCCQK